MTTPTSQPHFSRPLVFLHIPKTAGQTIHHALAHAVGGEAYVSPIRLNAQAGPNATKLPPGYRLYSGHLDWTELETLPNPFTFTVLRDPRERIASFYFFLLKEARAGRTGSAPPILMQSADDYFFAGDRRWQQHIIDHYDNFYCRYFATRRYHGQEVYDAIPLPDRLSRATRALDTHIDGVYSTDDLGRLEADLGALLGRPLNIANSFANVGPLPPSEPRWAKLLDRFERDDTRTRIESFVTLDLVLMEALGLPLREGV